MDRHAPARKVFLPGTAPGLAQGIVLTLCLNGIGSVMLTGCAHIDVKPKDPQLLQMQQFAEKVAGQLYDRNPATYVKSQQQLGSEIAPSTLKELKAHGLCAKNSGDAAAKAKTFKPEGEFKIDDSSFLKATDNGLIPVEVKGVTAEKEKFDIIFLIGLNKKTNTPLIVSVSGK